MDRVDVPTELSDVRLRRGWHCPDPGCGWVHADYDPLHVTSQRAIHGHVRTEHGADDPDDWIWWRRIGRNPDGTVIGQRQASSAAPQASPTVGAGWSTARKVSLGAGICAVVAVEVAWAVFLAKTVGGTAAPKIWQGTSFLVAEIVVLVFMIRQLWRGRQA
jgi:hypothetical protein